MGRPRQDLRAIVAEIRAAVPGVAIRSAFIVGFPGETESEFKELLSFLEDARLDRVGVFKYSREPGTRAADLPGQVPESVKERRYRRAMRVQQGVSFAHNQALVGKVLPVLVEGRAAEADRDATPFKSVGRSHRDAPEVDGLVFVRDDLPEGQIVQVRIAEAMEYDLVGDAI
jgi:ribosomal protein S12 methylthiotransferase